MQQRLVRKQDASIWAKKGWTKVVPQPARAREVGMTVDLILMQYKEVKVSGKASAKKKVEGKA